MTLLLQAFEQLLKECNDIELVVVDNYMSKSKGEKATYQREVRELAERLKPHCHMVEGVTPEEIYNYYSLAVLVVIPFQFQNRSAWLQLKQWGRKACTGQYTRRDD